MALSHPPPLKSDCQSEIMLFSWAAGDVSLHQPEKLSFVTLAAGLGWLPCWMDIIQWVFDADFEHVGFSFTSLHPSWCFCQRWNLQGEPAALAVIHVRAITEALRWSTNGLVCFGFGAVYTFLHSLLFTQIYLNLKDNFTLSYLAPRR